MTSKVNGNIMFDKGARGKGGDVLMSLNPLDWLELVVVAGFDAFVQGMTALVARILAKIPQRPKRRPSES